MHVARMPVINDLDFRAWEERAPAAFRTDPAWRFHAYRVALYALDCARDDMPAIRRVSGGAIADQLLRCIASTSANIGAGLGCPTSPDRARFISMALGSLRESFTWYQSASDALDQATIDHRLNDLAEIRSLLLGYQKWLTTKDEKSRLT
jgi:four helix bundle protein